MTQNDFFTSNLAQTDPEVAGFIKEELKRQQDGIELIASENLVSRAVLEAQGSIMTNKYAEGYPGKRYYGGCEAVDKAEALAIERACELFKCSYANVQPHSGSQANQGVYMALLKPGDTILGMTLEAGGHLTHGAAPNQSGKWFHAIGYGLNPNTQLIDYDELERLALEHKPKLIIAGGSAYPREIDFATFRQVADKVGAYLMVDMAHFAGLVAAGLHPSPFPFADVVTTTTHKTLRGPRGGMILSNNPDLGKKINSAIFPGLQGGPLMHAIAAKAVAFGEALQPEFKDYIRNVKRNAHAMGDALLQRGYHLVSGGTDTHLVLVDLRVKNLTGSDAEKALERAHLTCNKNAVPNDPLPPTKTSGIRIGSPAGTSRGFGEAEFRQVGEWIADVLDAMANGGPESTATEERVKAEVQALCKKFPIYERP